MGAVRLLPEISKIDDKPAKPKRVDPKSSGVLPSVIVGVGIALTVPVTATSFSVAPVLVWVILPETAPTAAVALIRALTVVGKIRPTTGTSVSDALYVVPSEDISTPAGAVMAIGEGPGLLPLTE